MAAPTALEPRPSLPGRTARSLGKACSACGASLHPSIAEVLSQHRTSEGMVTYFRCTCGGFGFDVEPVLPAA